jgi:hypothetical protein
VKAVVCAWSGAWLGAWSAKVEFVNPNFQNNFVESGILGSSCVWLEVSCVADTK